MIVMNNVNSADSILTEAVSKAHHIRRFNDFIISSSTSSTLPATASASHHHRRLSKPKDMNSNLISTCYHNVLILPSLMLLPSCIFVEELKAETAAKYIRMYVLLLPQHREG